MSTVVLVHGAAMDASVWRYQAEALAEAGFDPIAVDLPGHGESEGEPSPTAKGYAGWLLAYLSVLGEPVHLVGHSMGALVVLEAAAAQPDRVRSVTLVGISDPMAVNPELLEGVKNHDLSVFSSMAHWMHAREPIGEPEWTAHDTLGVIQRSRPGVAYADLTACNEFGSVAPTAARVEAPMLLLLGEQDVMTKPAKAKAIEDAARDARTVRVEGAGHLLPVERPTVANEALIEFLDEVESRETEVERQK
ncbi:MAG: alpha/beta hydrolase [Actinomycetota bacterium]